MCFLLMHTMADFVRMCARVMVVINIHVVCLQIAYCIIIQMQGVRMGYMYVLLEL